MNGKPSWNAICISFGKNLPLIGIATLILIIIIFEVKAKEYKSKN